MATKYVTWSDVIAENGPPDEWMDDMSSTEEMTETNEQLETAEKDPR